MKNVSETLCLMRKTKNPKIHALIDQSAPKMLKCFTSCAFDNRTIHVAKNLQNLRRHDELLTLNRKKKTNLYHS